jgi:hypothetical protein
MSDPASGMREKVREMVRQAIIETLSAQVSPQSLNPLPDLPPDLPSSSTSPREYYSPWNSTPYESHLSQRQVFVDPAPAVAAADCTLERGRNCDDCGKCRAFGF